MASLEEGLPDVNEFDHLQFAQPTKMYDRTGEHLLAHVHRREAPGRPVLPDPRAGARCHDRGRGPHLLGEPGLRPPVDRLRHPRQRDRGRRPWRCIDHHPAARACAAAAQGAPRARRGPLRAQGEGAHPVGQADGGVPGRGGQGTDHHRLPQPDLLRPQRVRHRGCGTGVLRQADEQADARPGGTAGRPAAVARDPRPLPHGLLQDHQAQGEGDHPGPDLPVRRGPQAGRPELHRERTHRPPRLHPQGAARRLRPLDDRHPGPGPGGHERADPASRATSPTSTRRPTSWSP